MSVLLWLATEWWVWAIISVYTTGWAFARWTSKPENPLGDRLIVFVLSPLSVPLFTVAAVIDLLAVPVAKLFIPRAHRDHPANKYWFDPTTEKPREPWGGGEGW